MNRPGLLMISLLSGLLICCETRSDNSSESSAESRNMDVQELRTRGDEISKSAQAVLLANVSKAIAEGGTEYAVEYCNLEASALMDSLTRVHNASISRISNRNRNPGNEIEGQTDILAWNYWTGKQMGQGAADTVIYARSGTPYYYKPIRIGMETCLQCHGSRSTEISLATLNVLDSLYPGDKAVNYRMGDLRGLWKIGFTN